MFVAAENDRAVPHISPAETPSATQTKSQPRTGSEVNPQAGGVASETPRWNRFMVAPSDEASSSLAGFPETTAAAPNSFISEDKQAVLKKMLPTRSL